MRVTQDLYYGYTGKDNNHYTKMVLNHLDGEAEALFTAPLSYQNNTLFEQVLEKCLIQLEDEFGNVCQESKKHIVSILAAGDVNLAVLGISDATHESTDREFNPQCPKCKAPNLVKYNTKTSLKYNKPTEPIQKRFNIAIGDRTFNMEWVGQGKIKEAIMKIGSEKIDKSDYVNPITVRNEIMKLAIKSIKNGQVAELLNQVPGRILSELIKEYQKRIAYGVELSLDIKCCQCGETWKQELLEAFTGDNTPGALFHFFSINIQ